MSKKDDFAKPADFSSFETSFQKVEEDYPFVEKEMIFYGNVSVSSFLSEDIVDGATKDHIKGNFFINDDCNGCWIVW